jgi:hypothetical protein
MPEYQTTKQQIKNNPVSNIKICFCMLSIIDSFNQIKVIQLPHFDNNNCNKS